MLQLHLHRKGKTQAEIDQAFQTWSTEKASQKAKKLQELEQAAKDQRKKRMDHESKKRESKLAKITEKRQAAIAAAETAAATTNEGASESEQPAATDTPQE